MTVRSLGADETDTNSMGSTATTRSLVIGTRAASATTLATAQADAAQGTLAGIATGTHVGSTITVTSGGDDSTKTATITGLDLDGSTVSETITLANASASTSANQYASIFSIVAEHPEVAAGSNDVGLTVTHFFESLL